MKSFCGLDLEVVDDACTELKINLENNSISLKSQTFTLAFFDAVLGMESRDSHMLDKCFSTKLYPPPWHRGSTAKVRSPLWVQVRICCLESGE